MADLSTGTPSERRERHEEAEVPDADVIGDLLALSRALRATRPRRSTVAADSRIDSGTDGCSRA